MLGWLIYYKESAIYNKAYIDYYIEEGDKLGIMVRLILVEDLEFGVVNNEWFLKVEGDVQPKPDFVINRAIYPLLSRQLESMGIPVFNNSFVSEVCNDKARTYQYLAKTGITMVDSSFYRNAQIEQVVDQAFSPTVIKTVDGHGGNQVFLIGQEEGRPRASEDHAQVAQIRDSKDNAQVAQIRASEDEAKVAQIRDSKDNAQVVQIRASEDEAKVAQIRASKDEAKVAQIIASEDQAKVEQIISSEVQAKVVQIIASENQAKVEHIIAGLGSSDVVVQPLTGSRHQDLRVYVIGDTIVAAVLRTAREGFKSNFSLGGEVRLYSLSEGERSLVQLIIDQFDFGLVGIDFIIGDKGELIFNEIEDVVGSRMLYQCSDINIVERYLHFILRNIKLAP